MTVESLYTRLSVCSLIKDLDPLVRPENTENTVLFQTMPLEPSWGAGDKLITDVLGSLFDEANLADSAVSATAVQIQNLNGSPLRADTNNQQG